MTLHPNTTPKSTVTLAASQISATKYDDERTNITQRCIDRASRVVDICPTPPFCLVVLPRVCQNPPGSAFFPWPRSMVVGLPLREMVYPSS